MNSYMDNRSDCLKKLDLSSNNKETIKKICALIRDEKDLKEFLEANHPDMREPIFDGLRRELNRRFYVKPFWALMGLPRPAISEIVKGDLPERSQ